MTSLERLKLRFTQADLGSDPNITLSLLTAQAALRLEATAEQQYQHACALALELQLAELVRGADGVSVSNEGSITRDVRHRLTELRRQLRSAYLAAGLANPGDPMQPVSTSINTVSVFENVPYGSGWR